MTDRKHAFRLQRLGLYGLILLVLLVVSAITYVLATGDDHRSARNDDTEEDAIPLPSDAPTIVFPERLRTFDTSLNRFIDRLIRVTREGRYKEFRQMWTRTLDPVDADGFTQRWIAVREVRILEIKRLPHAEGANDDAYLLTAAITLDEKTAPKDAARARRILIVREDDRWVLAPFMRAPPGAEDQPTSR